MIASRNLARVGGLLYLIAAVTGAFGQLYVRSGVRVPGDAAATAAKLAAHAGLVRTGFASDLVAFTAFLAVGLVMYVLFEPVSHSAAVALLVLNAVSVAISALNMLNQLAALLVATDPAFTSVRALPLLLLDLHQAGYLIAQIFFGLYLVPLGYVVYRSGFLPKVLGVVLVAGAFGYLSDVAVTFASSSFQSAIGTDLGMVGGVAELVFLAWLLIMGLKPKAESRAATRRMQEVA